MKLTGLAVGLAAFVASLRWFSSPASSLKPQASAPERALLLGDSLAVGLTAPLGARAKQAGFEFQALAKEGTTIKQWAASPAVGKEIASFKPTVVFVSLGTNDDVQGNVVTADTSLQKLLVTLGQVDLVWIGSLKPGPVSLMVQQRLGDAYFHSERLALPKTPDGLHTTPAGYSQWAAAIWAGEQ